MPGNRTSISLTFQSALQPKTTETTTTTYHQLPAAAPAATRTIHYHTMKLVTLVALFAVLVSDTSAKSLRGLNEARAVALGDPYVVTDPPSRHLQETIRCPKWAYWCHRTNQPSTQPPSEAPTNEPTEEPGSDAEENEINCDKRRTRRPRPTTVPPPPKPTTAPPTTNPPPTSKPTQKPPTNPPTTKPPTSPPTNPPTTKPPTNPPTTQPPTTPPTSAPPTKVPTTAPPADDWSVQLLNAVNKERANAGLKPLCLNAKLNAAAQAHAQDMADKNYFDHSSLDGTDPFTRMERQGYKGGNAENIAAGYATVEIVMDGWMKSAGHRANILGDSNQLGVGKATNSNSQYGIYWVQDFGKSSTEACL